MQIPRSFESFGPTAARSYDMMPDGRFIAIVPSGQGRVAGQVQVVLNWFEELKQQVK